MDKTVIAINICNTIIVCGVFFLIVYSYGSFTSSLSSELQAYENMEREVSCIGMEKYNGTFILESIAEFQKDVLSYPHNSSLDSGVKPLPPSMLSDIRFDCEDISHGIMCLAREYKVPCKFYMSDLVGGYDGDSGHIGVDCMVEGRSYRVF